ncbi:adenine phosphoribosyltransferase 2-like isoform X6 [Hevea brasiliensis]|uniref:adenine phosphoribosyltransferase 2-like isoform X6 n=1 Tax=Hevea brasiliensis TaxID=3981 RepID=UPI0025E20439|nr:adenine phosphoribosyltransferase 2-like isoform X6 [Hevea brasiliensis]
MFAGEHGLQGDPRLKAISDAIRVVPHFPKSVCGFLFLSGIMFQDITTLLLDHKAYKDTLDIFVDRYRDMGISVVAGEVISEEYVLEYGNDCLEMHVGAVKHGERAIIIDDLVATGGTLSAAIRLLERVGAEVVECACVIGLPEFKGQFRLNGKPLYILVEPRQ